MTEKDQIIRMSGVNPKKCMKCGKCTATCPNYDEMEYHPHQFVYMVENGGEDLEKLMASESIYKCMTCFACVERCPRGVEPGKLVEAIRTEVIRQQNSNRLSVNDIPAKIDEDMPQQALMMATRKYTR